MWFLGWFHVGSMQLYNISVRWCGKLFPYWKWWGSLHLYTKCLFISSPQICLWYILDKPWRTWLWSYHHFVVRKKLAGVFWVINLGCLGQIVTESTVDGSMIVLLCLHLFERFSCHWAVWWRLRLESSCLMCFMVVYLFVQSLWRLYKSVLVACPLICVWFVPHIGGSILKMLYSKSNCVI